MTHHNQNPQYGSFTMESVSELDMLLSLALVVAENKNEMKNISQLPLFIYPGDSEFISEESLKFWKKR